MKKLISFQFAAQASLWIFGLFVLFHMTIVLGIVLFDFAPVDYLWGGRMSTKAQLLNYEIVSMLVMAVCFLLTLIKTGYLKLAKLDLVAHISMWLLFALFALNTVGNFLAKTTFEKMFAIVTILLVVFTLRMALEPRSKNK